MKTLLKDFVDILYPRVCPGCTQVLASGETKLCLGCEFDLPFFNNEQQIEHILGGRLPVSRASIYLKFYAGGLVQRLLHQVKYKGDKSLGTYLGSRFMQHADNRERFKEIDVIVPVPLHETKLKQRGFNQSAVIAKGIAKVLDVPIDTNSVVRITRNETQTRKSRAARWTNVEGIFTCEGEGLKNKNVLLVDDVITTGATMEACAQAVLKAGVTSIGFAVLATATQ